MRGEPTTGELEAGQADGVKRALVGTTDAAQAECVHPQLVPDSDAGAFALANDQGYSSRPIKQNFALSMCARAV